MIDYTALDAFTETQIYQESDLVLGGTDGVSNTPIKALLDRTNYLNKRRMRFEDVKLLTGSYTYDSDTDFLMMFCFSVTGNSVFNLPEVSTMLPGSIIPIITRYNAIKALTIQASNTIKQALEDSTQMFMHAGEALWLIAASDHWEVGMVTGNFYTAGESLGGRKAMLNTAICNGSTFNRADMPRLSKFALSLGDGTGIVDDGTWLSDPGGVPVYRGCFSKGNNSTTLRLPDERGVQNRYLDLGRGLDVSRLHNFPGGYELDMLKSHDHGFPNSESGQRGPDNGGVATLSPVIEHTKVAGLKTLATGGVETVGKNIGKIPLIKY